MILTAALANFLAVKRENLSIKNLIETTASLTLLGGMLEEKGVEFQVKTSHS